VHNYFGQAFSLKQGKKKKSCFLGFFFEDLSGSLRCLLLLWWWFLVPNNEQTTVSIRATPTKAFF
jgi:hypothetical protein